MDLVGWEGEVLTQIRKLPTTHFLHFRQSANLKLGLLTLPLFKTEVFQLQQQGLHIKTRACLTQEVAILASLEEERAVGLVKVNPDNLLLGQEYVRLGLSKNCW